VRRRARQPRVHAPCVMTTGRNDPQILFTLRDHARSRRAGLVPGTAVVELGATMDLTGAAMREPAKKILMMRAPRPTSAAPEARPPPYSCRPAPFVVAGVSAARDAAVTEARTSHTWAPAAMPFPPPPTPTRQAYSASPPAEGMTVGVLPLWSLVSPPPVALATAAAEVAAAAAATAAAGTTLSTGGAAPAAPDAVASATPLPCQTTRASCVRQHYRFGKHIQQTSTIHKRSSKNTQARQRPNLL